MCHSIRSWVRIAVLFLSILPITTAHAQVSVLKIKSTEKFAAPRWMFDGKQTPKGTKLTALMVQARKAELDRSGGACISVLEQVRTQAKTIGEWVDSAELRCALIPDKKGSFSEAALSKATMHAAARFNPQTHSPALNGMRSNYVKALLQLADIQLKTNRRGAWATIEKLQEKRDALNVDDRARMYRLAGELAFVEQNLMAAQEFISRSLNEKDAPDLRAKLKSIRTSLLGKNDDGAGKEENKGQSTDLGVSPQEQSYYERMQNGVNSQDYVSAVEDGMGLITKFPGGVRASEATDKILEIYLSISANGDEKYRHLLQRVVHAMDNADSGRLLRWAQAAYNRGYYLNALEFAEHAYEKFAGHPDSTKALLLAGKAALAAGETNTAEDDLQKLIAKAAGSHEAIEAQFRMGLMKFRRTKYSEAVAHFERVLALNPDGEYEYRALYWEWRCQQKLKSDRADEYVKRLLDKYPVTYYGIRAQAEKNNGIVEFAKEQQPLEVELHLLDGERKAWARFILLLQAGWFEEAQGELQALPEPQTQPERLLRARLWGLAFRYDRAITLANRAWQSAPELVAAETLKWVYPKEFDGYVKTSADKLKLDTRWIFSLMRQESSFQREARSPMNALGLMQILPATAQQIATEIKISGFKTPDSLFQPETNIRIGSVYLSRLITNFNGNVPLALAAYNAGSAKLKRWLAARKELDGLDGKATSAPEVEIWMDELPWDETSFYVKAILRNWLVYRSLDEGKLQIPDPVWKGGA